MRYQVCVSIDGENFDPQQFQSATQPHIRGEVVQRKFNRKSPGSAPTPFWKISEVVADSGRPEIELLALLRKVKPFLSRIENRQEVQVTAELVIEYDIGEEPRGFFFDVSALHLLSEIGAQLDVDAVPLVK